MASVLTSLNNFVSATVESGAMIDVDNENKEIKSIVTDASGNYIKSSEIKQTADTISAKVKDLSTGLADTGIDIENHQITLTANNIKVKNNSGALVSAIDEYGQLISGSVQTLDIGSGHVNIKDGLISIFNSSNTCNIRFGLKDGYMVMSYYNNDGQLLYDLGPKGLDFAQIQGGSIEPEYYYEMQDFCGAPNDKIYYTTETYEISIDDDVTYPTAVCTAYQRENNYYDSESYFFPNSMGRKTNGTGELIDISGNKPVPQKNVKRVVLYKYTAARLNGVAIADSKRGLTAEQAKKADGKYFTTDSNLGTSDGINLKYTVTGWYIKTDAIIYQMLRVNSDDPMYNDGKIHKYPRYRLRTFRFSNGVYQTEMFASYAKRVIINGVESETECV